MSLPSSQPAAQNAFSLPMPPPAGWTPLETVEAHYPYEAELYKKGGEPLKAAVRADDGEWAALLYREGDDVTSTQADLWLEKRLLAVLRGRPDLQLTGYDLTRGIHSPPYQMPHAVLLASDPERRRLDGNRIYIHIDFKSDTVEISYSFHEMQPNLPHDAELTGVRIKALADATVAVSSPAQPSSRKSRAAAASKAPPSRDEIARWQKWRFDNWPAGKAAPTGPQCLAAARAHFGYKIPRDPFLAIREPIVSRAWKKPGRRRSEDSEPVSASKPLKEKLNSSVKSPDRR
ncbi:hypothetical protein JMJ56_26705 [Belnapia sp. T18]|uniref:Uncharacterized protein n=1 Tax=Belnapia arida TaxID=2804533 RepID=A0ABS1UA73_9PROT|nr:hypothetical protein [Belnapia arida]MBL6081586.1 hypothetical protein [Belnapia arida]